MGSKLCEQAEVRCTCGPAGSETCYLNDELASWYRRNREGLRKERKRIMKSLRSGEREEIDQVKRMCLRVKTR